MAKPRADLILLHAGQLATPEGSDPLAGPALGKLRLIEDGAVACAGDRILAVGSTCEVMAQVAAGPATAVIEARGRLIAPGLVDPHTHAIHAGSRQHELEMKLAGKSYLEILAAGGGILSTVRQTRAVPLEDLKETLTARLRTMLAHGATTVEVKTGYGLTVETELAHLEAIAAAGGGTGVPGVVPTLMAAHAVPPEWAGKTDGYVDLVCREIIPAAARAGTARFVDVFCEPGVFSVDQARRVLLAARAHGLSAKVHADELAEGGGAELAAEVGAVSAEHLIHASAAGIAAMAKAGVIAVLLPGTSFYLGGRYAPARTLISAGVPVALATDANPGTSPTENAAFMINLAVLYLKMTPAEVLTAATLNAACAIGCGAEVGSLEPGKLADLVVFAAPDHEYLAYHYGTNLARLVIKRGKVAWTADPHYC